MKGHSHDVADAFRQWAHCITYYRDYYEDSYLMPLVVSSLMGDASDVFHWTWSVTPGGAPPIGFLLKPGGHDISWHPWVASRDLNLIFNLW